MKTILNKKTTVGFVKESSNKIRNACPFTSRYRRLAPKKCNINVTKTQKNFFPFVFHIFSNFDCHLFFKRPHDKKKEKSELDGILKTNEEYMLVKCSCI